MRIYNASNRELVLPNQERLLPKQEIEVDDETVESWGKHPVLKAWVVDGWIEAELPDDVAEQVTGSADDVTLENVEELTRSKLIRYLKAVGKPHRGSREELLERAKEHLSEEASK